MLATDMRVTYVALVDTQGSPNIIDQISILQTIVESSFVLLGFSGAVVAFGKTAPRDWTGINRVRIWTLIAAAMGPLIISSILLVLFFSGVDEKLTIRICSAITPFAIIFVAVRVLRTHLTASKDDDGRVPLPSFVFIQSILYVVSGVLIWNAIYAVEFWPILLALLVSLIQGGYIFARLLFRPL